MMWMDGWAWWMGWWLRKLRLACALGGVGGDGGVVRLEKVGGEYAMSMDGETWKTCWL